MSLERFVPLLERICEVVHTAHEQGIVHRDLKPDNVMVISRAGRLMPKLLDFGIARARRSAPDAAAALPHRYRPIDARGDLGDANGRIRRRRDAVRTSTPAGLDVGTRSGAVLGSPPYMAPEVWIDPHGAGAARADHYALGALAYEALTGRLAFSGRP